MISTITSMNATDPPTPSDQPDESLPDASVRVFRAEDLFQGEKEIIIQHQGANYRLRVTKTGKLLLNK